MAQRTKIVCTMGPSTESDDVLRKIIQSGMRVARFNFSHGTHDYHRQGVERVKRISSELGIVVATMADTKGPEIRTRKNKDGVGVRFEPGEEIIVTARDVLTEPGLIALDYESLYKDVSAGSRIFVDDGLIELAVTGVEGTDIHCRVANGGLVTEHKGVNVPGVSLGLPPVTDHDKDDIRFACEIGMDAVAVSFVTDDKAPKQVRELCDACGRDDMFIISKIESALAIQHFDDILAFSDGIMVARGDLGVEIAPAEIPHVQKQIVSACNRSFKPVITATQMLESMTHNPRPTRAEVTDVANAIYDGTDCVMLSGETAAGSYPVEAVRMMADVCINAERYHEERSDFHAQPGTNVVSTATAYSAVSLASRVGAVALLCPTFSGRTACIMSSLRPKLPIIVTTPFETTIKHTCFMWGVTGLVTTETEGLSRTFIGALKACTEAGLVQSNDIVVITAGDPLTSPLSYDLDTASNVCVVAQAL